MSHLIKLAEGTIAPNLEKLTGDSGGAVGCDAAFNINLLSGTGLNIVGNPATNTLTFTVNGGGIDWSVVGAGAALVPNTGVICNAGAALSFSLPATSAVGNIITLSLDGAVSWTITQAANQQIRMGNQETTLGVGGSLTTTAQGNTVTMVCEVANLRWVVISSMGNLTVV